MLVITARFLDLPVPAHKICTRTSEKFNKQPKNCINFTHAPLIKYPFDLPARRAVGPWHCHRVGFEKIL